MQDLKRDAASKSRRWRYGNQAAQATHRPASQILRELMREYVQRQRDAVGYDEYFARKVEAGRASMQAGQGRSNEQVEAEFAARRAAANQS